MKRATLIALLAALLLGLVAGSVSARPATCAAVVDVAVLDAAIAELTHYSSDLQATTFADASRSHILNLTELTQALIDAPRFGCTVVAR